MLLRRDADSFLSLHEFKQDNRLVVHELGCYRAANRVGEFLGAGCKILFNLHGSDSVGSAFGLHRKDIVNAVLVDSDIDLISFNLPYA